MAAIGDKRSSDMDECDVSEAKKVKIHGVITDLSPVKTSKTAILQWKNIGQKNSPEFSHSVHLSEMR